MSASQLYYFIIGGLLGGWLSWLVTHLYSKRSSRELRSVNDQLHRDNNDLKKLVRKLPDNLRKALAADDRETLSFQQIADLVRSLASATSKRPMVQVSYSWNEDESKEKPFMITNAGDDEARNIQIHPVTIGDRAFTFGPVGQLLPNARPVARDPKAPYSAGLFFRTIIDGIEHAIDEHTRALKATMPKDGDTLTQFNRHAEIEMKAIDDFENIPVTVTFEDRNGVATQLEYRLETVAFAHVQRVELHFVREQQMEQPAVVNTAALDANP